jgi:ribosome-binding ATPase
MFVGIIGAPNKGKSTLFSAMSNAQAQIADYPFTTIQPNKAIAFMYIDCVCKDLKLNKCDARTSCNNGIRKIPISVLDVAGLVPDAHCAKGMGNQFLDDLSGADGFIQVVDLSARTDLEGKAVQGFSVWKETQFLKEEFGMWVFSILKRNLNKFKNRGFEEMAECLSGLGYDRQIVKDAIKKLGLQTEKIQYTDAELEQLARELVDSKKMVIAANKADVPGSADRLASLGPDAIPCSAEYELSLQKALEAGLIKYRPGEDEFEIVAKPDAKQKEALEKIANFIKQNGGTGVQRILKKLIFDKMEMIIVYPVEDENNYCDGKGRVLPDAILLRKGSTSLDLAKKIHTDLADRFIGAIDARSKRKISKEYVLNNKDIIKILSSR